MKTPLVCLAIVVAVFVWSAIAPYERSTWWMEVAPALIALPLLFATHKKFPLTTLLYVLIAVHMIILMVGGHYTYARVPGFEWLGEGRNNYDKIGHFAQGFIPAIIMRELMIRTSDLKPGKWMAAVIVFSCLGISAVYELIEWGAAVMLGQGADEFLGTQGDVWDTQKDMAFAGLGAISALLLLSRAHDKALSRL
jgi:putative membrane protein